MENNIPKLRTIPRIVKEIRETDGGCYVTEHMIRTALREGKIKSIKTGNRNIVSYDDVIRFLKGECE